MEWFVFALIPPLLWSMLTIIDKFFLSKYIKSPYSYQILIALSNLLIIPIFLLITPIEFVYPWSLFVIGLGVLFSLGSILYNKSIMIEEPSRISIMFNLIPIMVAFMAYFFLGEQLGLMQYSGVSLIILGAFLVSYKKSKNKLILSPALFLMLLFTFNVALYQVLTKYFFNTMDYLSFNFWSALGVFASLFILLIPGKIRRDFINEKHKFNRHVWLWRGISTYIYFGGLLAFFIAVDYGFVTIASVFISIEPLIVIIYTAILCVFVPNVVREEISRKILVLKIISALLIVSGAYLIII